MLHICGVAHPVLHTAQFGMQVIFYANSTNSKVVCCYSENSLSTVFVNFRKTAQNSTKIRWFYITITVTLLNLFCDIKHVIVIHS